MQLKNRFKISGIIIGALIGLILLIVIFVSISGNKSFDAPYPDISASTDSLLMKGENTLYSDLLIAQVVIQPLIRFL